VFARKQNKAFVDLPEKDENLPVWALLRTKKAWRKAKGKAKEDKGNVKQGVEEGPGLSELSLDDFLDIFFATGRFCKSGSKCQCFRASCGLRADIFANLDYCSVCALVSYLSDETLINMTDTVGSTAFMSLE
jgi:hypothetical protein